MKEHITPDEFENQIDNEIKELAAWFGGYDQLRKKVNELEQLEMEEAFDRAYDPERQ